MHGLPAPARLQLQAPPNSTACMGGAAAAANIMVYNNTIGGVNGGVSGSVGGPGGALSLWVGLLLIGKKGGGGLETAYCLIGSDISMFANIGMMDAIQMSI